MVRVDLMPLKAGLTDPKHDWAFLFDGLPIARPSSRFGSCDDRTS
jgi:hypothetical protein